MSSVGTVKQKPNSIRFKDASKSKLVESSSSQSLNTPKQEPATLNPIAEPVTPKIDSVISQEVIGRPTLRKQKNSLESSETLISRQGSGISKSSSDSNGFLKIPPIDAREDFYPPANTSSRGTSAPVFYTVKAASRPVSSKIKTDKMSIPEMITEFRNQLKLDANELRHAHSALDLNEEQMKAFEYPRETSKAKIVAGLIEKKTKSERKEGFRRETCMGKKTLFNETKTSKRTNVKMFLSL